MSDHLPAQLRQRLRFNADNLLPAIVQDAESGQVLMLAWMDETALARTLRTGRVWFWSRSRQAYWRKGDTSGHIQQVVDVQVDCDGDTVLVRARQVGAACHTGTRSCFTAGGFLSLTTGEEER